ncbi:hypothetical protein [Kribbella sp. VKM Ac-2568]|uniref:hypothetical protein n=1 Tax=Kribbella sp. VKM Ac-2568 TaxID=2512219 RepID=UPI0010460CDD|nr:hypothetical protein [Kribbella sp. VKM Ac-2568]
MRKIKAHVDVNVGDDAKFEELARWWLDEPRSRLFSDLLRRVEEGKEWMLATVGRVPPLARAASTIDLSGSNFEKLLASLRSRGERATWLVDDLSLEIACGDCTSARVEIEVFDEAPEWVEFEITASYRVADDAAIPIEGQQGLVELVAEFCHNAAPSFGNIASDNSGSLTALEALLRRQRRDALAQSEAVLRGYSWVTVCPSALVKRLGGSSALEASGAFVEVRSLRSGALLKATETFEEYDDEAVMRVFKSLAPVLPVGVPHKPPAPSTRRRIRLVYEDASIYR